MFEEKHGFRMTLIFLKFQQRELHVCSKSKSKVLVVVIEFEGAAIFSDHAAGHMMALVITHAIRGVVTPKSNTERERFLNDLDAGD